jgi:hypothetical protein
MRLAEKLDWKRLIRPLAVYGAEYWTLDKDIAKRLAAFEKKSLTKNVCGDYSNANCRERYNKK